MTMSVVLPTIQGPIVRMWSVTLALLITCPAAQVQAHMMRECL
jgi:hypothetical protein